VCDVFALRHKVHGFALFLAYNIPCSTTLGYASGYATDKIRFFVVIGALNLFTSEQSLRWRATHRTPWSVCLSLVYRISSSAALTELLTCCRRHSPFLCS